MLKYICSFACVSDGPFRPGIPLENVIRQNQLKMFQFQNLNYTADVGVKKDQHSVCQYKNLMLPCYYTNTTDNINNLKNKSIIYNTEKTVKLFISCRYSYHILIYSTLEFWTFWLQQGISKPVHKILGSDMQSVKGQTSLGIPTVSPDHSLLTHTQSMDKPNRPLGYNIFRDQLNWAQN